MDDKTCCYLRLQDLLPFNANGNVAAVWDHATEIFDQEFGQPLDEGFEVEEMDIAMLVSNFAVDFLQTIAILYLLIRVTGVARLVTLLMARDIPMTVAHDRHECQLPQEAYSLLLAILLLNIVVFIPPLMKMAYKKFRKMHDDIVQTAAQRIALEERV